MRVCGIEFEVAKTEDFRFAGMTGLSAFLGLSGCNEDDRLLFITLLLTAASGCADEALVFLEVGVIGFSVVFFADLLGVASLLDSTSLFGVPS